ncbi:DUF4349 domain-containing protein [Chitinophaga silvatica]|uniref:DUF4349 domain-containing protein n=1 Tax=Chitinophaga silvatica TaxID=2282649 RepID=A0A3E1Y939_9BACT|nr:DUF4349 domain-containing protein [Chitinophaga silvatica]RFS21969.1 DUF4349 domain-containing protein [Chitinophaga silvatica]
MRYPILYLIPLFLLAACGRSAYNDERAPAGNSQETSDSYLTSADSVSFSNNLQDIRSASRKRVRTADLSCNVNDVAASTFAIESIITRTGGITRESIIKNETYTTKDLPYTADSLKRVVLFTPVATLNVRVPVASLDTVVRAITDMATFIEHRTLKEDDKTLQYLTNALRNEAQAKRGTVVAKPKDSTIQVAEYNEAKDNTVIDRRMNNLAILDDVAYANFSIQLFQPQVAKVYTVVNPDHLNRAGFGTELLTSLRAGTTALRNTLLFFVEIWPFVLVAIAGWIVFRRFQKARA